MQYGNLIITEAAQKSQQYVLASESTDGKTRTVASVFSFLAATRSHLSKPNNGGRTAPYWPPDEPNSKAKLSATGFTVSVGIRF